MNLMKKQIILQENLLTKLNKILWLLILLFFLNPSYLYAKEKWEIDTTISKISFEVPVLFASNVVGEFKNFNGFVELDLNNNVNNKAIFSVELNSMKINYEKYRDLILGPVFFDSFNHPLSVLDTKKFSYANENELNLKVELTIKGISKDIETKLQINKLTKDIVQIIGRLEFKRNDFNIGIGSWRNTTLLKNNIIIKTNIFLIKQFN